MAKQLHLVVDCGVDMWGKRQIIMDSLFPENILTRKPEVPGDSVTGLFWDSH